MAVRSTTESSEQISNKMVQKLTRKTSQGSRRKLRSCRPPDEQIWLSTKMEIMRLVTFRTSGTAHFRPWVINMRIECTLTTRWEYITPSKKQYPRTQPRTKFNSKQPLPATNYSKTKLGSTSHLITPSQWLNKHPRDRNSVHGTLSTDLQRKLQALFSIKDQNVVDVFRANKNKHNDLRQKKWKSSLVRTPSSKYAYKVIWKDRSKEIKAFSITVSGRSITNV